MNELVRKLTILHTSLIDARSGYQEGLNDAHGQGLTPLFANLIARHGEDAAAIAQHLKRLGAPVDDSGSLMGTFDRVVMKITSLLTKLDEKIIPSLIDGEQRVLAHYDAAIAAAPPDGPEHKTLIAQRDALRLSIADLAERARQP